MMALEHQYPSEAVLDAFGVRDRPRRLPGGQGTSYLAGSIVLKPVSDEREAIWRAELMSEIVQEGFRVAKPIMTKGLQWVYDGWQAFSYVQGQEVRGRWKDKISVSRAFHEALRGFARPSFLDQTAHPWAIADRMVWGEQELEYGDRLEAVMSRLLAMMRPLDLPSQLIHGDMSGNILFHPGLAPAVIDLSPYWRPAEYATAIIIADAIVWEGALDELIHEMADTIEMNQLLVRAAMWRIKTTEEYSRQFGKRTFEEVDAYAHLIDLLETRVFGYELDLYTPTCECPPRKRLSSAS